jgi:signal transduction histidine kinase/ActR/RegA family two-component response regulator
MFSLQPGKYSGGCAGRLGLAAGFAIVLASAPWRSLSADASAAQPPVAPVEAITDLTQIWPLSTEMKAVAHPLRIEGRVNVYDPGFGNSWFEKDGVGVYVPLSKNAPALKAGQRVLIEGSLVPAKGLDASAVTVTVLKDYEPIVPVDTKNRIEEMDFFGSRIVSVEAYVDRQWPMDKDHVRLELVVGDRPVIAWLKPDNAASVPNWQGSFVRLIGMYSSRFDSTGTRSEIEIWVSRQSDLTVIGSLADYHSFSLVETPIARIHKIPVGQEAHVRGRILRNVGASLVIQDSTGDMVVQSAQGQRVSEGAEVEAVGRVEVAGGQWHLRAALYRQAAPGSTVKPSSGGPAVLESIDQIRQLTSEEAARSRPVSISGTVIWTNPKDGFFFLQGVSGGIRVRYRRDRMEDPRFLQNAAVEGVTYYDGFVPAVDLTHFRSLGSVGLPPAMPVTFDQAITGKEDGQWVEMRGFLERTESYGDQRRIYVATATGEFVAFLDSQVNFVATPGSLVSIRGVCEIVADASRQVTGLMLRVPFLHNITVDEDAPADFFDLPLRPIKNLEQLSVTRDLIRVRVSGIVLHAVPGRVVFLQDAQAGLLLLSSATGALSAGDSIEAVGILGREGARTVLREAVYHKLASGVLPAPLPLSDPSHFASAFDGRLVNVRGTLIDVLPQPQHTRLTLQSGSTLFEAVLDHPAGAVAPDGCRLGAMLEITGVYRAIFDDARQLRGFQLQLRSWGDVAVVHGPRLWTVQRALAVASILGIAALLGVAWVVALRRRGRQQTEQIRGQMERQARLEAEVQRAARLESLGVLAGGIAHDFNNLLTVVIGNLSLAMLDPKIAESAGGFLREIERAAFRARDLTQQLLTFARGGNPVRASVALPEIVREAAGSMLHGSSVRCEYDVSPGLWSAHVDKDQITQTVQNLTLNSVEAMPAGGVIRISLANEEVATGAHHSLAPGRYVRMAIADSGKGIKPEILSRVFDPYFSTKEVGGGLGLATVYSIIKRHDGWIEAESTPGHGATFTLWLPASDAAKQMPPPPVPVPAPAVLSFRMARVLLMDDEDGVRRLGETLLLRMGLKPVTVSDGGAALEVFAAAQKSPQPFDLVILDLTISGGIGGREVIERIRKLDPNVPAIVSSGYSNDPVLADFASYGFQAVVPKPYEINQLAETVKRLLAQRK